MQTETDRIHLHHALDAVLGADDAETLMSSLPPVTWEDLRPSKTSAP